MLTDLAATVMMGAVALLVIGAVMVWVARTILGGSLPFGGRLALRPSSAQGSPAALLAANQAAAPFLQRYGVIVIVCAVLVILLGLVSAAAALVVHVVAIVFLVLAALVCRRKADAAA